jgi:hypothetical protein
MWLRFLGIGVDVFGEVVCSEISQHGVVVSEQVPDDDQDRAPDRDKGALLVSPFGDAPIPWPRKVWVPPATAAASPRMAAR